MGSELLCESLYLSPGMITLAGTRSALSGELRASRHPPPDTEIPRPIGRGTGTALSCSVRGRESDPGTFPVAG